MRYGLIGEKLGHSFSKQLHEMISDKEYELCEIPREDIEGWLAEADFEGINVTIPYKEIALKYCIPDEKALAIGSVNTLVKREGKVYGYNTDADGFLYMLNRSGISLKGKTVAILGSGGTAKTAVYVADREQADKIVLVSRNPEKCGEWTSRYNNLTVVSYDDEESFIDASVVINATPVGMYPEVMKEPIDICRFNCPEAVADVIYNPLRTRLCLKVADRAMRASNDYGGTGSITVTNGLSMLVMQACEAERIWNREVNMPTEEAIRQLMEKRRNIVLVGMPGSGKSTLGRLLSQHLNRTFFDTDIEFEREYGISPGRSILDEGEATMREKEKCIITTVSNELGAVIATGGGAVLDDDNTGRLSCNGLIVFLDRDIEKLEACDRPLSQSKGLQKIYNERIDKYRACADITIKVCDNPNETVDALVEALSRV